MSWAKIEYCFWCQHWVFGITTFVIDQMSRKSEIVFRSSFIDRYFCFNMLFIPKPLKCFSPKSEIFLTISLSSLSKMIVLLLTSVKSLVSKGLTIKTFRALFTSPTNISGKARVSLWCFLYLNSSVDWVTTFFKTAHEVDDFTSTKFPMK